MFRFTLMSQLCRDLEQISDTTRTPDRIRQDVSRSPGGDSRVFLNNCIGCHTLLGEGAYFAPELGNVYARRGPDFIKTWMKIQPTHVEGRRQMPQFNFSEQQLDDLVEFLRWTGGINTEKWPPNIEG